MKYFLFYLVMFVLFLSLSCIESSHNVSSQRRRAHEKKGLTTSYTFDNYAQMLSELSPLQKTHYSWAVRTPLTEHPALLSQYVRITGALSIQGESATPELIASFAPVLNQHGAKLGINYSPWHRVFPPKPAKPYEFPDKAAEEVELFRQKMQIVHDAAVVNNVTVGAILLDSERFLAIEGDAQNNDALDARYNEIYDMAKTIFPDVKIHWYNRGAVIRDASATGWSSNKLFTLRERGDSYGISLYRGCKENEQREMFRRTWDRVQTVEVGAKITPWVALGSGYKPEPDAFHRWTFNWNYDLIFSYNLGSEINHPWFGAPDRYERFGHWDDVEVVAFYPEPFGRTHRWGTYFVSYVRGAQLTRTLPDD